MKVTKNADGTVTIQMRSEQAEALGHLLDVADIAQFRTSAAKNGYSKEQGEIIARTGYSLLNLLGDMK